MKKHEVYTMMNEGGRERERTGERGRKRERERERMKEREKERESFHSIYSGRESSLGAGCHGDVTAECQCPDLSGESTPQST